MLDNTANNVEMTDDSGCFHFADCDDVGNVFYLALPIFAAFRFNGVDEGFQERFLDEIKTLQGEFYIDNVKIEYKSLDNIEDYSHITHLLRQKCMRPRIIFLYQMSVSNASHLLVPYENFSAEQCFIATILSYLQTFAYSLAYALGLYCEGLFDVDNFVVYYNKTNYGICGGLLSSFSSLHDCNDVVCDAPMKLSLQKTLNWFLSIDDVLNACGKTALGKSLSIYSRMFSSISGDDEVFMSGLFSVMALEALYESHGVRKVLAEKVAVFLGLDKEECRKKIYAIYHHRCSVAHGGFVLPFKFNVHDGSKEFENAFDKTQASFDVGLHYLFKSYRKMILENKKELVFACKNM